MNSIYLAIQDYFTNLWTPVARVEKRDDLFRLRYTRGAQKLDGFEGFGRMKGLGEEFVSSEIFPILKNRILSSGRPEYSKYISWLGLEDRYDVFEELARTGGLRATDSIELIPEPRPSDDGTYIAYFFMRGIRHLPAAAQKAAGELSAGQRLYVVKDIQNTHDGCALLLRTDRPVSVVGYVPRYYTEDFTDLVSGELASEAKVTVERVNPTAPLSYRVLCKFEVRWPLDFQPCNSPDFGVI